MFDFEKLKVYQKVKSFNHLISKILKNNSSLDRVASDQLRRASFSIMLNIAEGTSRFSKKDRKNFYVISRGSVFECVAIVDFLKDEDVISDKLFNEFYSSCEELSKMLFAMVKGLE